MAEHISFFDAIEANKRNSILLIVLMGIVFILVVAAISYIFDIGLIGPILGVIVLFVYTLIVFYSGDAIILSLSSAKEARKEDFPFLFETVEGLALASQIPTPKIYVINDQSPNAFATGRDPKHASIAVTTGLLSIMNHEELEGVIAHEMSHIGNYDIRFAMIAVVFLGAIAIIAAFTWRMAFLGGIGGGRRDRRGGEMNIIIIVIALVFVILAPIFVQLVQLALSRQREYLADANGARMTRYPEGLASALEKIKNVNMPTKEATDTTASLYFSNPFPKKISVLGSTHPPIDDRIKRLRSM